VWAECLHAAAIALFIAYYNFVRVHSTTRITPAMGLGITDHVWSLGELIDAALATPPAPTSAPVPTPPKKSFKASLAEQANEAFGFSPKTRKGLRVVDGGKR